MQVARLFCRAGFSMRHSRSLNFRNQVQSQQVCLLSHLSSPLEIIGERSDDNFSCLLLWIVLFFYRFFTTKMSFLFRSKRNSNDKYPEDVPYRQKVPFGRVCKCFQFFLFFLSNKTEERKEECFRILVRFPEKVPIILEKYQKETRLKANKKIKYLVPQDLEMIKFIAVIRGRLDLLPTDALYFLINGTTLATMSKTMAEIYNEHKHEDGFLYITYASQETFGSTID